MAEELPTEQAPPPIVTAEEFAAVNFEDAISSLTQVDGFTMAQAFQNAMAKAQADGREKEMRVYALLNALCSMHFTPEDRARVWGPMFAMGNQRSAIPSDFVGEHTKALSATIPGIKNVALRARLADICWTNNRRNSDMAKTAVDAYCECVDSLLSGTMVSQFQRGNKASFESLNAAHRALQIAYATNKRGMMPDGPRTSLRRVYESAVTENAFVIFANTAGVGLYYELLDPATVAKDSEALAAKADSQNPIAVKTVWDLGAHLYARLKDDDGKRRCQIGAVDQLLLMRKQVSTAGAEASWVMDALQELRHIKGMDDKIEELERDLRRLQRASVNEMAPFSIELDVGEAGDEIVALFTNHSLADALKAFAMLTNSPDVSELKKQALDSIKNSPLMAMMAAVHLDDEGKTITRTSGAPTSGEPNDDWFARTIDRAEGLRRAHIVAGWIEPARVTLATRYTLDARHFEPIVACSSFVPATQKPILILGFARFFQGDFMSAIHLVIPQLEPCLRHLLKVNGYEPAKRFDDATEEELDLVGMLVRHRPELDRILTPNIAAEIERLFHLKPGPALRHGVAHGLLGAGDCYGPNAIYAVWLMYRFCCLLALQNWDGVIVPLLGALDPD